MKNLLAAMIIATATPIMADCDFDRQVEVLALNMYHEARGEGLDAMQMVAEVTLNRVDHPAYPDDVCSVVYQRRQFSWTHMRRDHTPYETEVWQEALELAENLLLGDIELFDNGATHFLNPNAVRRIPSWARKFEQVGQIGNHVFYEKPHG
jgi:N-acetylmuramoyl-L-alanine amidase